MYAARREQLTVSANADILVRDHVVIHFKFG